MSQNLTLLDEALNGPAMQPPEGQVPNFTHPSNLNAIAHFTNIICLFSTFLVTVIRAYAKLSNGSKLEIEDALAFFGMGTYCGSVWCSYQVIYKIGAFTHQWDVRLRDLGEIFYLHHLGFNLCAVTTGFWQAAIVFEWNRLFVPHGTRNSFYWIGNVLLTFTSLATVAYIVAENLSCIPYEKIWNKTILEGYCIDQQLFQIPGCLINTIYIAGAIILTQRTIWRLRVATKKKIEVSFLFLFGLLALASSIVRLVSMIRFLESDDKTYMLNRVYLWTLAENSTCFIALCLPWSPKAFSNATWIRNAIDKLLLYICVPRRRLDRTTASSPWAPQPIRVERDLWDSDRVCRGTRDARIPLVKYPSSGNEQSEVALHSNGILMTTEIVVVTDSADRMPSDQGREFGYALCQPVYLPRQVPR
ncbi:hypothetical protein F5Y11DRAFT_319273 [Daldinia sp. FL1419]|nr:hypothetical protein F5Y11DRAFT_319273 [Daldinia sp. FL1419]